MNWSRRACLVAPFAAGLTATGIVQSLAQSFPSRPITFVYPYDAGSNAETVWRVVVSEAQKILGQSIVVEDRPGAGGRLGADYVMHAKADGYTTGAINNAIGVIQPLQDPSAMIVPGKEYLPVVSIFETGLIWLGRPDLPFKDIQGLVAYAKANPGRLNVGNSGQGTGADLATYLLEKMADIKLNHVVYKGNAPQIEGLLSGEVDAIITDAGGKPYVDSGKMIPLGTTTSKRWSLYAAVPTVAEQGYPGYLTDSYMGLMVTPGTPPDVIAKLNSAFNQALKQDAVVKKMKDVGMDPLGGTPDVFAKMISDDLVTWKPIIEGLRH